MMRYPELFACRVDVRDILSEKEKAVTDQVCDNSLVFCALQIGEYVFISSDRRVCFQN